MARRPAALEQPGGQFWVGSWSSICALERPLLRINLTFARKGHLLQQQRMSVSAPNGPSWWQTSVGICGGIESKNGRGFGWESLAPLVPNTQQPPWIAQETRLHQVVSSEKGKAEELQRSKHYWAAMMLGS